jgi:FtsZ-binding cell division protein ZapB
MSISKKNLQRYVLAIVASVTLLSATPALVLAHGNESGGRGWGFGHLKGRHGVYWQLCKTDKDGFKVRLHRKWMSVDSFQEKYAKVLERLDTFVTENNLTVENADQLKGAIDTAATNVATELNELKAIKDTVNCDDSESVEANTEAFKTQVQSVKDALKTYRDALKAYKQAIHTAADAVNSETE